MTLNEAVALLKHLPDREADCRCGNVQLTPEEVMALRKAVEELDALPTKCFFCGAPDVEKCGCP